MNNKANNVKDDIKAIVKSLKGLDEVEVKSVTHAIERSDEPESRCYVMEFSDGRTIKFYIFGKSRCTSVSNSLTDAKYLGIDKAYLTGTPPTVMAKVGIRVRIPREDGKGDAMLGYVFPDKGGRRSGNDYVVD